MAIKPPHLGKITLVAALTSLCLLPGVASAGPCSDDIATMGRQLSGSPAMGPPTTGTLSGSSPGSSGASLHQGASADVKGTSGDQRVGGTAGTKEMDAASSKVATSDADVRQQQAGNPTAAGQAAGTTAGKSVETTPGSGTRSNAVDADRMSRAKVAWQKAVDLNARNDTGCKGALAQAKQDLQGS